MAAAAPPVAAPRFVPNIGRRKLKGTAFYGLCILAVAILLLAILILLVDVFVLGVPWLNADFITGTPSRRPADAGILPALVGSIQLVAITCVVAFPIGLAAAISLEEYAKDTRLNRLLRANISNLSGVPSIIYGIFGLAIFVRTLSLGYTLISGALTLALLILPIVIITSMEAMRAVPGTQREAAYALGATRWQVVRGAVLPSAAAGILTGIILAVARAIGEAAPLILVGAVGFVTFLPSPLEGGYTVLPIQIFDWASRPQEDFQGLAAATIIVLLVLLVILDILAVVLRIRLSRHIQW
ncbi:MAG: phosphate ABC transporter permease PstA [Candidatus Limnocylindrales bacterium]